MIGESDLSIPEKMLDFYALRHKLIAHNIANAAVPGYRKLNVDFTNELRRAVQSEDPKQLRTASPRVSRARQPGVEPEAEVAKMTKNELLFNTFAEIAAYRLRLLRSAIKGQ